MLPELAVSFNVCVMATSGTVALNPTLVELAGTDTEAGNVTATLSVARLTVTPPEGAAAFRVTVHVSVPAPVIDERLQESALNFVPAEVSVLPVPPPGFAK
jgi:hypothetical protein